MLVPSSDKWEDLEKAIVNYPVKRISPEHFMARFQCASSMDTDSELSRLDGSLRATGEEQEPVPGSQGMYDAVGKTLWEAQQVMVLATKGTACAARNITKLKHERSGVCLLENWKS